MKIKINMPNLVLFKHTLRMDNSAWQTYIVRLLMIIFTLIFMAQLQLSQAYSIRGGGAPGLMFFGSLSGINMAFIIFYSISLFSTTITEEREANILSLVMMTGLSPFTMILSKSCGRLISGLMLLIVQLPFTVLAVTLGGISLKQIAATYILLASLMFLLSNIALVFSVVAKKSSTAAALTFLFLIGYGSAIGISELILERYGLSEYSLTPYFLPFDRFGEIFKTGFDGYLVDWNSALNIILGSGLFLIAWLIFNRFCWESPERAPVSLALRNSKRPLFRLFKLDRPWRNAISWKQFHFNVGGRGTIATSLIVMSAFIGIMAYFFYFWDKTWADAPPIPEFLGGFLLGTGIAISAIKLVFISSEIFSGEIWDKTIQETYTVPATLRSIVFQKLAGSLLILIPSIVFAVAGFCILLLFSTDFFAGMIKWETWLVIWMMALGFLLYLYIVSYTSLFIRHGVIIIAAMIYGGMTMAFSIFNMPLAMLAAFTGFIPTMVVTISVATLLTGVCIYVLHRLIGIKLVSLIENPGQ